MDQLAAFYRRRGVVAHVDLCPLADPSLLDLLGRRGYRLTEWNNVLARPLGPGESAALPPAALEVRPATFSEAELWARVVAQGFSGREEMGPSELEMGIALFDQSAVQCFLGMVDGEPAGGGAVAWHLGVATLLGAEHLAAVPRAGVANGPPAGPAGLRRKGGVRPGNDKHRPGQHLATQRGAAGLPCRLHETIARAF